jgi:hypothetical protein
MIEKIRRIAANPLEAASLEDKEALHKERMEEEAKKKAAMATPYTNCVEAMKRYLKGET